MVIYFTVKCWKCGSANLVCDGDWEDCTGVDVERVQCYSCGQVTTREGAKVTKKREKECSDRGLPMPSVLLKRIAELEQQLKPKPPL